MALSTRLYEHSPRQHTSGLEHLTERQGLWLLGALALHQYGDSGSALRELDYLTQDMVDARTEHAHLEQVQAIYQYISVEAAHSSA